MGNLQMYDNKSIALQKPSLKITFWWIFCIMFSLWIEPPFPLHGTVVMRRQVLLSSRGGISSLTLSSLTLEGHLGMGLEEMGADIISQLCSRL